MSINNNVQTKGLDAWRMLEDNYSEKIKEKLFTESISKQTYRIENIMKEHTLSTVKNIYTDNLGSILEREEKTKKILSRPLKVAIEFTKNISSEVHK